ncbi:hypothetical protein [Muricoccus vinaceus]|uniref:Uncharacterized protein n=1 Tax=Muricoccus vinaceus TaxID=424704 RepID=A0ABV6IL48_9PROT
MSSGPVGPGWRADVRDRVAAILADQVPVLNGRVHRARVWPVSSKPALLVYGYAERKEPTTQGGFQHQFRVTSALIIRVLTEGPIATQAEVACEDICGQVERAILRSPALFSPTEGILQRCAGVTTQLSAEQKERAIEVEATIEFQLVWEEVFTMAEPDTSECAAVSVVITDPSIPSA